MMDEPMEQEQDQAQSTSSDERAASTAWNTPTLVVLGLFPFLAMAGLLMYLVQQEGGIRSLSENRPPVEKLHIDRVVLPSQNLIKVHVTNDGPEEVRIAQVLVDEAYWRFELQDEGALQPLSSTVVEIPYMWVRGSAHEITLISDKGVTFSHEIPVALETPQANFNKFLQFGLVGVYVGIIPVFLGMLWFPLIRRVPSGVYHFVLAVTLGLLAYLAVGTWLEAMEFAEKLASFWQGVPMVVLISSFVFLGLMTIGSAGGEESGGESSSLRIAYLIALGIGLHNFGEGLAIGAAYAGGELALSTFLIVGFALHNLTEGVGIVAPVANERPAFHHFLWLLLLGGAPAIFGTWIGVFAFQPLLGVVFLSIGIGAIVQVIWEVGKLLWREMEAQQQASLSLSVYSGLIVGALVMYITGWLT